MTPQVAYNPRFDFASIHRVAVVSFAGSDGSVAADMITQSLVAHGANVIERQQLNTILSEYHLAASGILDPSTVKQVGKILGVDALFVGTVVASVPSQSYVVTNNTGYASGMGYPSMMGAQVTPITGNNVYSQGAMMGVPGSQIVTSAAQVAMISRMVDVQTGQILWSASMSYQGLDRLSAISDITDSFINSLVPIWPQLIAIKS
jgi:curli biogenesis system outer membrane secretion channel CsgG